jgi:hypothetical protein
MHKYIPIIERTDGTLPAGVQFSVSGCNQRNGFSSHPSDEIIKYDDKTNS